MKRALLHSLEPGRICEVVEVWQEFEVHENFSWVDVPDDTTTADTYDLQSNTVKKFDPLSSPGFVESGYMVARAIGYGSLGNQLDMLFHELTSTGTISNSGPWATHIASIKSQIPKDNPQAVHDWNMQYLLSMQGNI